MEQPPFNSEPPPTERELVRMVVPRLQELLPPDWDVAATEGSPRGADGFLRILAPDGREGLFVVESKTLLNAKDVPQVAAQVRRYAGGAGGLVVARYLSPRAREALASEGLSYLDSTGNTCVRLSNPGLSVLAPGADRDPYRGPDRPTQTLKGVPASKVVRALVDCRPPWNMRALAAEAGTSLGSTARTVNFLDREALVRRDEAGSIVVVDWEPLLRRWAEDYDLVKRRRIMHLLVPRGLDWAEAQLREGVPPDDYVISGSLAARRVAPYAEARLGLIYAREDGDALARRVSARAAPSRPNLLIIEPMDDLVFLRPRQEDGLRFAGLSQVVADLLSGPGRSPEEALALLAWMRDNEDAWRS